MAWETKRFKTTGFGVTLILTHTHTHLFVSTWALGHLGETRTLKCLRVLQFAVSRMSFQRLSDTSMFPKQGSFADIPPTDRRGLMDGSISEDSKACATSKSSIHKIGTVFDYLVYGDSEAYVLFIVIVLVEPKLGLAFCLGPFFALAPSIGPT